ncbi:right-handed parallel beta-helix repeat-containing protein [Raoultibacter phocaeensis]|uniref:right-handed parallel beta-helix repeat-containing protein n=1 Tax=Raoultibacter phocaeensis TaxID=2479841 RepID=UPI0015D5F047|nr:right-handed parallel beta-helix repeat-containing protein [Raoultibacter phocaeensis]
MKRVGTRRIVFAALLFAAAVFGGPLSAVADEAAEASVESSNRTASGYVAVDLSAGYGGTELPAAPRKEGAVWIVTPENAQYALDGAYGPIDGKTIRFSGGPYEDPLVLARTTKYPGSRTIYYDQSYATTGNGTPETLGELTPTGVYSYVRTVENLTLTSEDGVVLPGFEAASGHVYGTGSAPAFDYVRETTTSDTNGSHYDFSSLKNITFEGLAIEGRVFVADYSAYAVNDGIRFEGCAFLGDASKMGDGSFAAIKMMADTKPFANVTVSRCTFSSYFQGIYLQGPINPCVVNSLIEDTAHNAIALQSSNANPVLGEVIIAENIIQRAGDRAIRFGNASRASSVIVENNVMLDSGDSDGELFKAESLSPMQARFRSSITTGTVGMLAWRWRAQSVRVPSA